jgi:hypothetical protein
MGWNTEQERQEAVCGASMGPDLLRNILVFGDGE